MSAAAGVWHWTTAVGAMAAAAGAAAALKLTSYPASRAIRLSFVWALALAGLAAAAAIGWLGRTYDPAGLVLPPALSYEVSEAIFWFCAALPLVASIRLSAERSTIFRLAEIVLLAAVLMAPLAGHRDGFVNRPFELVDGLMSRGWDPLPIFLAAGAGIAALIGVWLMATHEMRWRNVFFVLTLVVACFAALPAVRVKSLLRAASSASLKRQAKPEEEIDFSNGAGKKPVPVAVVIFRDDYNPANGACYFRQSALSRFNGRRLVQDNSGQLDTDIPAVSASPVRPAADRDDVLRTEVSLLRAHARPFALVNATWIGTAENPDPLRFEASYLVESAPVIGEPVEWIFSRVGSSKWSEQQHRAYTETPADARYGELVRKILASTPTRLREFPAVRALAVKLWLDEHVTYSRQRKPAADDPVGDFLFGDRRGYCVHFAHAACLLYRTAGVPARVATGYMAPDGRRGNGSALLIQGSDAHAWAEIYLEDRGWMPLDVAPHASDEAAPPEADHDLQRYLGEVARKTHRGMPEQNHNDIQERTRAGIRLLAVAAEWLLAGVVIACYGIKLHRYWAPRWCALPHLPVTAYRWTLDRMAEAGRTRAFGQSREQFATVCGGTALCRLTENHLAATLGKGPPMLGRAGWLGLSDLAAREGTAGASRARRMLGCLNPFSWWRVR